MKVLVLCTGNSCRSQIAEGYLRQFAPSHDIYSAGVETHGVNQKAVKVMLEDGVDISAHTSNNVDEYSDVEFDLILTVCDNAKENCPFFPSSAKRFHFNFPDPAKATGNDQQIMTAFRETRDMIKLYSQKIVLEHLK